MPGIELRPATSFFASKVLFGRSRHSMCGFWIGDGFALFDLGRPCEGAPAACSLKIEYQHPLAGGEPRQVGT
jgi:hypothetical protein